LPVTALPELSESWEKEGADSGADVSGIRHGKKKKAFGRLTEGL
jgi:hypothetical protein